MEFDALAYLFGSGEPTKGRAASATAEARRLEEAMLPSLRVLLAAERETAATGQPAWKIFVGDRARNVIEASHFAFLDHAPLQVPAMTSRGTAEVTAECQFGKRQLCFFCDDEGESLLVRVGNRPVAVYRLASNRLLLLEGEARAASAWMISTLALLRSLRLRRDDLFTPGAASDRRVLLVGDERPTHFIRQMMGFLELNLDGIQRFIARGGQIARLPSMCFVDPVEVFPALVEGLVESGVRLDGVAAIAGGIRFGHRPFRGQQESITWARRLVQANRPDGGAEKTSSRRPLRVLISLDVEKDRFINQHVALRAALRLLSQAARRSGRPFEVLWDGWTLGIEPPTHRDVELLEEIDALSEAISTGIECRSIAGYRMPLLAKLEEMHACAMAITPHGTAALLPCRILRIPTITYHAPIAMVNTRDEVDDSAFFPVPTPYLREAPEMGNAVRHRRKYEVERRGLLLQLKAILRGTPAPGVLAS